MEENAAMSKIKLANSVLFAAGRHIGPDDRDGIAEIATKRIHLQYEGFLELMKAGNPSEEICKALGIYIARLEILLAQSERRVVELEKELAEKQ
jgi:hypothetical protein